MCGRFTLTVDPAALQAAFPGIAVPADLPPRYNVAPTQPVAVVANNGQNKVEFFRWGLIPSWAKDISIGSRLINARAETLAEKPSFRAAFKKRRCLILADGFYEWRQDAGNKAKTPMVIRLKSGEPFAFAGLWELWRSADDDTILSCTIVTTKPNSLMEKIHNRMPVILKPEDYTLWLDPEEQGPDRLSELLRPYPALQMTAYAVSTMVNNPALDSP
ncbi:MAG: SOS response-associated peptidase, partial [Chloroflexi bacterium]|nr:SOS response-associated peptidase [Chloroflexota bacterium]